jgi:transposase
MPSMQLRRDDVIVGVDTHKDQHVAVLLDGLGGRVDDLFIPATLTGFAQLLAFCERHIGTDGQLVAFGVEGTGSYGIGLARFLRRHGHTVHEVHRPPRKGERRLSGKSDTIDAEHAARQVLSGARMAQPKTADGQIEALRLIKIARDTAVKARTTAMITLKATLVTAGDELRAELEPLTDFKLVAACAELESATSWAIPTRPCGTSWARWPDAGLTCTRRSRSTADTSRSRPRRWLRSWCKRSASDSTSQPSCS